MGGGGGESLADCGAFDGDTLRDFITRVGSDFNNYYAIEMDNSNYDKLSAYIAAAGLDERVQPYHVAVCDKNEKLTAFSSSSSSATSSHLGLTDENTEYVEGIRLDDLLAGKRVTFLKADIEGAEMDMLRGAEGIIRAQKPKCAICVYHNVAHFWQVPQLLKRYNPDYKFYFRLHSRLFYEVVCYAIPTDALHEA